MTKALAQYWTHQEICAQPVVLKETAERVSAAAVQLRDFLRPLLDDESARIILTGAGTSAFAGQLLAPYLTRVMGRQVEAIATTDLVSNPSDYFQEDVPTLLVSFARSGNSPESVAAVALADELVEYPFHLVITCAEDGQLAREKTDDDRAFVLLMPPASNDRGFAMTSSFTSMTLSALLTFAPAVPVAAIIEAVGWMLEQETKIAGLAASGFERIVYVGSGPLVGVARESALKMLELTAGQVVSYYDSSLGFRHGPKSVLNDQTLVVCYVSTDPYTRQYDLDIVRELRGNLGEERVLAISGEPAPEVPAWVIPGALTDDAAAGIAYVVFAQLLAAHCSHGLGLTVDNPFPGGEVNRVVQGVTIHPLPRQ